MARVQCLGVHTAKTPSACQSSRMSCEVITHRKVSRHNKSVKTRMLSALAVALCCSVMLRPAAPAHLTWHAVIMQLGSKTRL